MAPVWRRRVCLDFSEVRNTKHFPTLPPTCWISFESGIMHYIYDFKSLINCRFKIDTASYSLYMQNALIPESEHIDVLRDGDTIKIVPQALIPCIDLECEISANTISAKTASSSMDVAALDVKETSIPSVSPNHSPTKKRKRKNKNKSNSDVVYIPNIPTVAQLENKGAKKQKKEKMKAKGLITEVQEVLENEEAPVNSCTKEVHLEEKQVISPDIILENDKRRSIEVLKDAESVSLSEPNETLNEEILEESDIDELPLQTKKKRKRRPRKRKSNSVLLSPSLNDSFSNTTSNFDPPKPSFMKNEPGIGNTKHIRFGEDEDIGVVSTSIEAFITDPCKSSCSPTQNKGSSNLFETSMKAFRTTETNDSKLTTKSVFLLNCDKFHGLSSEPKTITAYTSELEAKEQNTSEKKDESLKDIKLEKAPLISNMFHGSEVLYAPPRVGDTIAYKVLELSETYCPEVSKYKVAKVISYEPNNDVFEVEIVSQERKTGRKGKFDLQYSDAEEDIIDLEMETGSQVQVKWQEMLEPRLLNKNRF